MTPLKPQWAFDIAVGVTRDPPDSWIVQATNEFGSYHCGIAVLYDNDECFLIRNQEDWIIHTEPNGRQRLYVAIPLDNLIPFNIDGAN